MLATNSGQLFKQSQERFIKKNKSFLKNEGQSIKPVKVKSVTAPPKVARVSDGRTQINIQGNPQKRDLIEKNNPNQNDQSQKLEELADKVSEPLLTMTTIPLLELFPTTITIDLKKITVKTTTFYKSHSVQTFTYDYIREISLETGLISSALRFVMSGQFLHPLVINHFRKDDAVVAKRLILGLMQCYSQKIRIDELDPVADREKIITLGSAASP